MSVLSRVERTGPPDGGPDRMPLLSLHGRHAAAFANNLVAQHPVDPLGLGVGVPSLVVGRAYQEAGACCSDSHCPGRLVRSL